MKNTQCKIPVLDNFEVCDESEICFVDINTVVINENVKEKAKLYYIGTHVGKTNLYKYMVGCKKGGCDE